MDDFSKDNQEEKSELPFGFRRLPVDSRLQEENWKAVEGAIRQGEMSPASHIVGGVIGGEVVERRSFRWGRVLAAAACLVTVAIGIWWIETRTGHPEFSEIRTGYGEIKNILLPDSSVVILNANSSMRIPQQWTESGGRQVWLEGEAYFQVQKQPSTVRKFVVHTRQVDVEVLGTKFNVNARRQRAVVSLEEGKVRLSMNGVVTSVLEKKAALVMRPGQVAEVDEDLQTKVNEDRTIGTRSGWTRHEFHFDNTSLGEIAGMIKDTYGYDMVVEDSSMLSFPISGDLRKPELQDLLKVLQVPTHYVMRIRDKTIYVTMH
jgi:ferric-dicitrate binding protein FerR (iron transport regulator)